MRCVNDHVSFCVEGIQLLNPDQNLWSLVLLPVTQCKSWFSIHLHWPRGVGRGVQNICVALNITCFFEIFLNDSLMPFILEKLYRYTSFFQILLTHNNFQNYKCTMNMLQRQLIELRVVNKDISSLYHMNDISDIFVQKQLT